MKSLLCKLGFHKPDNDKYERVVRYHRTYKKGKKYHRNYVICKRCGKRLGILTFEKRRPK